MKILVTGGAGFIGSNFVSMAMTNQFPEITAVVVLDKLTYAGKLSNLHEVINSPNLTFVQGDICDPRIVDRLASDSDAIINFAAESHVDRSIQDSTEFIKTNVLGTQVLLDAAKKHNVKKFLQVSTDEVYGSILKGSWTENSPLEPNSPYSASKAAADLLVRSYFVTHKLNTSISRCSNNFGPRQDPEKLILNAILKLLKGHKISIYGDGANVRDWVHVEDHCRAIYLVLTKGVAGEVYNVGGSNEISNIQLARLILTNLNLPENYIEFVKDRPGHDFRYSVDHSKINQIGYHPSTSFNRLIKETINWYSENYLC